MGSFQGSGVFGHQQQWNIDERPSHTPFPMAAGAGWHCSVAGTGERTALSLFECKKKKGMESLRELLNMHVLHSTGEQDISGRHKLINGSH